nr:hypothetical protein [Tanacetum cinerariifolium]
MIVILSDEEYSSDDEKYDISEDDDVPANIQVIEEYSSDDEKYDISEDDDVPAVPWDDVIIISSDEEPEMPAKKVSMKRRKHIFALVDESDSDDDCWSNAFLF